MFLITSILQGVPEKRHRALWVWITEQIISKEDTKKEFLHFLKNLPETESKITTVYLYVTTGMLKSQKGQIRDLIRSIHEKGVEVEFLNGTADWAIHHSGALYAIKAFNKYQQSVAAAEMFDGFQFDVEPHILPAYRKDEFKKRIDKKFLELIEKSANELKKGKKKVRFGLAVPTLFTKEYIMEVYKHADYLAVMDYVDRANRILHNAMKFIEAADELGKKVVIGLETQIPNMKWGVKTPNTFYDEGSKQMEKAIGLVEKKLAAHSSYFGFAIHDYRAYTKLTAEGKKMIGRTKYPDLPIINAVRISEIKIDGMLNEWEQKGDEEVIAIKDEKHVVFGKPNWKGNEDFSAVVRAGWDAKFLYLAFSITDEKIVQKYTNMDIVNGDHIELWIDYDYEGDKDVKVTDNDDFQFGFSPGDFKQVPPSKAYWFPDYIEEEIFSRVQFYVEKTEKGYDMEVAIPFKVYPGFQPKNGALLRISIEPSDTDENESMQETLLSTSPHRKFANPRTFRVLQLK